MRTHDGETSICVTIAEALAAADGVDVTDLDVVLAELIDPEALDCLYDAHADADGSRWRVEFTTDRHDVVVASDGTIQVT